MALPLVNLSEGAKFFVGLLITLILGIFILLGALISHASKDGNMAREVSAAVALGAMVALLVLDLGPEAVEATEEIGFPLALGAIAVGFAILVVLDKFLPESQHTHGASHDHGHSCNHDDALHISIAATIAIAIHNVVEGMSVCGIAAQSTETALLLALGVGIHNSPMGMLIYAGVRDEGTYRKVTIVGVAALSTFVGGLVMFFLSQAVSEAFILLVVCLTIGLLLYIVVMELIPHAVRAYHKPLVCGCAVLGAALVVLSTLIG